MLRRPTPWIWGRNRVVDRGVRHKNLANLRLLPYRCPMNWQDNITRWRSLPPEEKLRRRWEAIPDDVAESMAFEGEPVPVETIRAAHARTEPPAMLKPLRESSVIPN